MTGTLYGLGLGPGDPELVTLKSWRIISLAPVIAWPEGNSRHSRARAIAAPFIPEDVTEEALFIPFGGTAEEVDAAYAAAAKVVSGHLEKGRDVAFLCLGDPLTYGTFGKLAARLSGAFEVRAVPGVTAPGAAAARLGHALAQGDEPLKFLPAIMEDDALLAECLNRKAALAILKAGHHLPRLREVLARAGRLNEAVVVQELDGGEERIAPLREAANEAASYFTLVLVYPQARAPAAAS